MIHNFVGKSAWIVGGTSGMGRAISQKLVERGDSVFLLGFPESDLTKSAADLKARHTKGETSKYAVLDLEKPDTFAGALDAADKALSDFDTVIVTAAMFATPAGLPKRTCFL